MDNPSSTDNTYNQFSINAIQNGTSEFLQSNSLIAKIAFLLFVLFIFVILLRLGITFISWLMSNNLSPHFLDGMINGKHMKEFIQDPHIEGSKTIGRSNNEDEGIEFTWSIWLLIDDLTYGSGRYKHIFHKGDDPSKIAEDGLVYPNNAPGLYLAPYTNALKIIMNTYTEVNQEITIPDIPMNKWVNVIIRCKNTTLDIYINGVITQSIVLLGVPKQNYGNVWLCANGGFSGYVSNLWYYNYALSAYQIARITAKGPNRTMIGDQDSMDMKKKDYLSLRWYFFGNEDMFNA